MKFVLTLASLAMIYKSTMSSGDPTALFSNLTVLFAMYCVTYSEYPRHIKLLKITRGLVFFVGFICFLGWIEIITVMEYKNTEQYFISISEDMKLGNIKLMTVHVFFLILSIKLSLISGIEWMVTSDNKLSRKRENKYESIEKGA